MFPFVCLICRDVLLYPDSRDQEPFSESSLDAQNGPEPLNPGLVWLSRGRVELGRNETELAAPEAELRSLAVLNTVGLHTI